MDGDADRAALIGERTSNRLADPPGRVGRELVPLLPVELVHRAEKAEIPFLNQVEEREVGRTADVLLRNRDHETQVAPREDIARFRVALLDALRELALFGGGQKRVLPYLAEVDLDGVVASRMAIFDIARREIFVGRVFKHAAFKDVDTRDGKSFIQRFEEADVLFDMRK